VETQLVDSNWKKEEEKSHATIIPGLGGLAMRRIEAQERNGRPLRNDSERAIEMRQRERRRARARLGHDVTRLGGNPSECARPGQRINHHAGTTA
jgi:hypothetical protein